MGHDCSDDATKCVKRLPPGLVLNDPGSNHRKFVGCAENLMRLRLFHISLVFEREILLNILNFENE